jgi:FtsP/CotA-like multicopper oxidase with cupredoxin domain
VRQMITKSDFQLTDSRYHAHSEVQRGDGLYGGLVVHDPITPRENFTYQYKKELLFLVGDWYHWQATKVLANFMDRTSMGNEVCSGFFLLEIRS